jgi:hypothetical protein
MKTLSFTAFFLLTSCAAPEPIFKPVTVDVPVAVPCRTPAIRQPASPLRGVTPEAPLFDKVKAALIEIDLRKVYEAKLEAALTACQ